MSDPRLSLSSQLVPAHGAAALNALDSCQIRVIAGLGPAESLTAAAFVVLAVRSHAHIEIVRDVPLPPNPWAADSLGGLLTMLSPLRPSPACAFDKVVSVSTDPDTPADLWVGSSTWIVSVGTGAAPPRAEAHASATAPVSGRLRVAPFGGLLGAAVAAAHLFCSLLEPLGLPVSPRRSTYYWAFLPADVAENADTSSALAADSPLDWPRLLIAGCGSVGSSAAAALACGDLTGLDVTCADGDAFDPIKNNFRYPAAVDVPAVEKTAWVGSILEAAGACAAAPARSVAEWTCAQASPGLDGIVVSSVDTVDGRFDVADVLARTTLSAAVDSLSFHVQREHLGDGFRCPYCDFVTLDSPLAGAANVAAFTGLTEQRIVELLVRDEVLTAADVAQVVAAGRLDSLDAVHLVGRRLDDLRARLYAQAAIPAPAGSPEPPVPLSAPFVSWAVGVLLAVQVSLAALGLPMIDRRLEVDLHGYLPEHRLRLPADGSGRCVCARPVRCRWMAALYPDLPRNA